MVDGQVGSSHVIWSDDSSICIVAASGGYPGSFSIRQNHNGLEATSSSGGVVVFHSGTARDEQGGVLTAGGRVLGVTARGATLQRARELGYEAIGKISFEGMHFRTDIAAVVSGF